MSIDVNDVVLEKPTLEMKTQIQEMVEEITANSPDKVYPGFANYNKYPTYEEWLDDVNKQAKGQNLPSDFVPALTYVMVRKSDKKIIGLINIRTRLNKRLQTWGGHLGFTIRPTERQKGFGKKMLALALKVCHRRHIYKVLVTCDDSNEACCRLIESFKGDYSSLYGLANENVTIRRYWITNN